MKEFTLVIRNKKYSSWSLRAWIVLKLLGVDFEEILIPLYTPDAKGAILKHSPSGKVPALLHRGRCVWETIAIGEYLAEIFPNHQLWPADAAARAMARSVSAEMHAGFANLRQNLPMDMTANESSRSVTEATRADIARVTAIWNDCRSMYGAGGEYLFGKFTIADAMYAPVVNRFTLYGIALDAVSERYREFIWNLPAMREWREAGRAESWKIDF